MHSTNSMLAQSLMFESSSPKIINSYWKDVYVTHVSFQKFILDKLNEKFASQTIFECYTKNIYSYKNLGLFIRKAAKLLDVPSNEYVVFIGPNSIEYLSLYFGAIYNGAITFNLPHAYNSLQDIQTFIIQHNIQYLVFDGDKFDLVLLRKLLNSVALIKKVFLYNCFTSNDQITNEKIVRLDNWLDSNEIEPKSIEDMYRPQNLVTEPCLAVNSNGTNQWPPRLCLYNHYSMVATCETIADGKIFEFRSIDSLLVYGSFEHLENLIMFLSAIVNGCTITLLPYFDYISIIDAISRNKIYLAILPSNFLIKLLKDGNYTLLLKGLVKIIVFGSQMNSNLCRRFFENFTNVKSIRHCYFIAESPCPITIMNRNSRDYNSIGFPLPNTRIKILSWMDNNYEMLEANRSGLICVGRDKKMFALGYLSNKSQTIFDLNLRGDNQNNNECRWLITSDIGFYDNNHLIYLHGQFHDSTYEINSVFQQARIERNLLSHPLISEAYVCEIGYKKYAALVVLKFINTYLTPELTKQITDYIKENNAIDCFQLFVKYSLTKTSSGRYIDYLMRKEIMNLNNIRKKF